MTYEPQTPTSSAKAYEPLTKEKVLKSEWLYCADCEAGFKTSGLVIDQIDVLDALKGMKFDASSLQPRDSKYTQAESQKIVEFCNLIDKWFPILQSHLDSVGLQPELGERLSESCASDIARVEAMKANRPTDAGRSVAEVKAHGGSEQTSTSSFTLPCGCMIIYKEHGTGFSSCITHRLIPIMSLSQPSVSKSRKADAVEGNDSVGDAGELKTENNSANSSTPKDAGESPEDIKNDIAYYEGMAEANKTYTFDEVYTAMSKARENKNNKGNRT